VKSAVFLAALSLSFIVQSSAVAATPPPTVIQQLTADAVADRIAQSNEQRYLSLKGYRSLRKYSVQYSGLGIHKQASLEAELTYTYPGKKTFHIISTQGSALLIDRVLKRLLESEVEASDGESRAKTEISRKNYRFAFAGGAQSCTQQTCRLHVEPLHPSKFLYRGDISVDMSDFAVTAISAHPAKSPSFWTTKTDIEHRYGRFGEFWLPVENRSTSEIRLGGSAKLTIDYGEYVLQPQLTGASSAATAAAPEFP
jgi:hypothetical protein